jgi:light-regulated signal transduction histidine kinase (bacteriophytochrome)
MISVFFGLLSWCIDGIIDYFFFKEATLEGSLICDMQIHHLFMRLSVMALFLIFGLVISHILTRLKETEGILKQHTEELARSNAELEQFAYVASHDLQEPLRMVSSYVQLLARRYKDRLDADANDFIDYAVDGANRMQQLINDLLTYSRIGTIKKDFKSTDCEALLAQVLENLQVAITESNALIEHEPLPTITCDGMKIGQVFQNLINNAIKFCNLHPPHIRISAEEQDDAWIFSVRDNGIGIDPKYAERIFLIFQRLHDRNTYPGTGIGLSICKKIVERHGGRIWVASHPGEGSTFYFSIPKGGN